VAGAPGGGPSGGPEPLWVAARISGGLGGCTSVPENSCERASSSSLDGVDRPS